MSKIFKKIAAIAMAGVMATSMALAVSATTQVCPPHYAGNPVDTGVISRISAGKHEHVYYYDPDGTEHTKTCWITIEVHRYETKCMICKELLNATNSSKTVHSVS